MISRTNPRAVFLENVENLVSHDHGNTIATIINTLEDELGKFNLNKSIQSEINEYLVFLYNYSEHKYGYEKSVNNFRDLFNDAFIYL